MKVANDVISYASDLERAIWCLQRGLQSWRVAEPTGLHRPLRDGHFHTTPELFLQTGGATDFECLGGRFRLATGELCVMPAGVPHAEVPVDLRTPYGVLVVMQDTGGCMLVRGRADDKHHIHSEHVLHSPCPTRAFQWLEEASSEQLIEQCLRRGFVAGLLTAFLSSVISGLRSPREPEATGGWPLVTEVEKLIRVEISRLDLNVKTLASRVGCSPDHLTRQFRVVHGITPVAWITRERMRLALNLLNGTRYNIAEVGWASGFSTPSYFIRVFRKHTGITPLEWRRKGGIR